MATQKSKSAKVAFVSSVDPKTGRKHDVHVPYVDSDAMFLKSMQTRANQMQRVFTAVVAEESYTFNPVPKPKKVKKLRRSSLTVA